MPQYLALADKLADIRKEANPRTMRLSPAVVNPIEVASFTLYQGYPIAHSTVKSVPTIIVYWTRAA